MCENEGSKEKVGWAVKDGRKELGKRRGGDDKRLSPVLCGAHG